MLKFHQRSTGTIALLFTILGTSMLSAADLSTYRGLKLGMSLAAASKLAGARPGDATSVQKRPAEIQQLNWELRSTQVNPKPDPVKDGLLSFYNGQLFRIIVTYDRYKIEGMSADDLVQAISETYGTASKPTAEIAFHLIQRRTPP